LTVHAASGPFAVTAPNTNVTWTAGTTQTVTWDPAGTSGAPIAVANVRILLSTDNGQTFPTVLAASTPNDGSQSISAPNVSTSTARVKIEAIGNIFFDISNAAFSIAPAGGTPNLKIKKVVTVPGGGYVLSGGTANIKEDTQNIGNGASVLSHTKFYWSNNKTFDGGDILLNPTAGREVPAIAPNGISSGTTAVSIPAAGVGAYFLIAVADGDNTNAESNENDNAKAAKIFIGPDLLAAKVTLSNSTVAPGGQTTVTLQTQNKGKVAAGASVAQIYYSADNKLTGADQLLASINVGPLNPGQKATHNQLVTIPGNAASGTRYIFAKVDGTSVVGEAQETNNEKKVTITVQ
jgi:subtilase family serine protease